MFRKKSEATAEIYINFGKDTIKHQRLVLQIGSSVLDALRSISDVQYTPDDSATGHCGSVVTGIDGARSDMKHFWMYYVSDKDLPGWRIPMQTPDSLEVTDGMRIAWRYHDAASIGKAPRFGPRYTSRCSGGRCSRQF
jgi:hypothetical protein